MGLFSAILDAIHGEDNRIAGQAVTKLLSVLSDTETATMSVESTIGFGEYVDGAGDARLLLGGEIISAAGRTSADPFTFTTLARGEGATTAKQHVPGTLVYDISRNQSALDHVYRGFLVAFAIGGDLDVIGRNLGLKRCPGLDDDEWRRIIQTVAYLPKQTVDAFNQALLALFDDPTKFNVSEHIIRDPFKVFVQIETSLSTSIKGRMNLNGGESQLTTGALAVDTNYDINHVFGVYADSVQARRGLRAGLTNFFLPFGSFLGSTITLSASPGAPGTAVLVDYGAFTAHYLAPDETELDDGTPDGDRYAYLSDPLLTARCLLDQIRAAGVQVELGTLL